MRWDIYFIGVTILIIGNQAISDTAKESVCLHEAFISKIVCWFFTNNLFGLVILVLSVVGLYYLVRAKSD